MSILPQQRSNRTNAIFEPYLHVETVVDAGVDVRREVEAAAVPQLVGVVRYPSVMGDQSPAGELTEDCALVLLKDDDINVAVIAGLTRPRRQWPSRRRGTMWRETST